ncbi:MAG: excinuclease ABC subunit B, partial [Nitrospirae bacterium]
TERRRRIQLEYNRREGIKPETIKSNIKDILSSIYEADYWTVPAVEEEAAEYTSFDEEELKRLEEQMKQAAKELDFERAAQLRDRIKRIKERILELGQK